MLDALEEVELRIETNPVVIESREALRSFDTGIPQAKTQLSFFFDVPVTLLDSLWAK
jgi:hypothetical protein